MDETIVKQILNMLSTLQEACQSLYDSARQENHTLFTRLYQDMREALSQFVRIAKKSDSQGAKKLDACCSSCLFSLIRIYSYFGKKTALCLKKIEFELLPLLQEAYLQFYIYEVLATHPERIPFYEAEEIRTLCANTYLDEAIARGSYKYDLSIVVVAYNKLEYTRLCVENLLQNLPRDLRYELIFVNHGSSDGTMEYFSSKVPDKQLDIAVNGGGSGAVARIVEGEFTLAVSNDVIVGPHAISNLYTCMQSDPKIAWVVASTPNIANLQTIPADYHSLDEFRQFAEENNQSDWARWEQRIRLCNPIDLKRNSVFYSSSGLCINGRFHSFQTNSFPDDRFSLLLRHSGYKMMLDKDAYCFHFGSVTLKQEVQAQGGQDYYLTGRKEFYRTYGVDPWGTGFCFAVPFLNRVVGEETGHIEVLGINCGLGSNSLKIKEQIKEYCRNRDVTLWNITDAPQFIADLRGISDQVRHLRDFAQVKAFLAERSYDYIVWEDPFLFQTDQEKLIDMVQQALNPCGRLFVKKGPHLERWFSADSDLRDIGNGWYIYQALEEDSTFGG